MNFHKDSLQEAVESIYSFAAKLSLLTLEGYKLKQETYL